MKLPKSGLALRTTLLYLLFGGLWILLSDRLLFLLVPDPAWHAVLQTFKGWFFILVSGGLLYLLLRSDLKLRGLAELAREELAAIVATSEDAILSKTLDGVITSWNRGAERLYGYSAEEAIGRSISFIIPPDRPNELTEILERIRQGEYVQHYETVRARKDGKKIEISITVSAIRDGLGNVIGASTIARDITERKKAEDALRASHEQLLSFIEQAPISIAMFDRGMRYLAASRRWVLEYGRGHTDLIGRSHYEVHPDISAEWKEAHRMGLAGETLSNDDDLWIQADGTKNWLRWAIVPWNDTNGETGGIIISAEDITQRKQAERALHESEERLRQVWESTSDAMTISDENGIVQAVNPACYRLYGYTPEQIIGHSFTVTLPEEAGEQILDLYKAIFLSGSIPPPFETVVRRADGTERVTESTITFLINAAGERIAALATVRDITERKQAQEALRESEALYRLAIETAGAVPYREVYPKVNEEHIEYQFIGEGIRQITGYGPEEFNARVWENITLEMHPREDLAKYSPEEAIRQVRSGKTPLWKCDFKIRARDGTIHWVFEAAVELRDENGISHGSIGIYQDITERKQTEERIKVQIRQLSALHEIDLAISGSVDLRVALDVFLRQVVTQLNVDAAAVWLFHPLMQTLEYAAGQGFRSNALRQANLKLGESFAGRAVLDRRVVHTPGLMTTGGRLAQALLLADEDFNDYYAVPLMAKGQVKGVLEIYHRTLLAPDPDWLEFLDTLAGQGAIAIDNSQLFDSLQRSNTDLTLAYDATIEGWSRALDLRDKETEGHTLRVTELTLKMAQAFGLSGDKLMQARRGALLHDIGKMGVPDGILLKPGPLTDEEWVAMKKHPTFAYDMLAPIHYLQAALDIPYCHHEKWDGTGYPRGLKGEQIPLVARLFAVVDVWDALTNDRPYRPAWSREKSLEFIRAQSGKHFDPQAVNTFLTLIADQ